MRPTNKVNTPKAGRKRAPALRKSSSNAQRVMRNWLDHASAKQKRRLAESAQTQVNYLYKIASGYRKPSVTLATRLAAGSREFAAIPVLEIADLVDVYYAGRKP